MRLLFCVSTLLLAATGSVFAQGSSDFGAAVNATLRANAAFISSDDDRQVATFESMANAARSFAAGHFNAYSDSTSSSWLVVTRNLSLWIADVRGEWYPPSVEYRLSAEPSGPYVNFGNDEVNTNRTYSKLIVSQENTRSPNPETRWPSPDVLTGELRADSAHYECSYAGSVGVQVLGLDPMGVARLCMQKGVDAGELRASVCSVTATGVTCQATVLATGQQVAISSALVDGGNSVSCTSGRYYVAQAEDPFSSVGSCVRGASKAEGSGVTSSFQSLLDAVGGGVDAAINPEIVALVSDLLWQYVATQPGYAGVPYLGSGGVSAGDVVAGLSGTGLELPSVGSALSPVARSNTQAWDVPTVSGPILVDGSDGSSGGTVGSVGELAASAVGEVHTLPGLAIAVSAVVAGVAAALATVGTVLQRFRG